MFYELLIAFWSIFSLSTPLLQVPTDTLPFPKLLIWHTPRYNIDEKRKRFLCVSSMRIKSLFNITYSQLITIQCLFGMIRQILFIFTFSCFFVFPTNINTDIFFLYLLPFIHVPHMMHWSMGYPQIRSSFNPFLTGIPAITEKFMISFRGEAKVWRKFIRKTPRMNHT